MVLCIEKNLELENKQNITDIYFILNYIMGLTFKQKFNKKHGFPKDQSHSIKEIAKLSNIKYRNALKIVEKGRGAFFSAGPSRPNMTPTQWGIARLYASVSKGSKSAKIDKDLLF